MTRLDQLSNKDLIRMTCGGCGRVRDIPALFLAAICGEHLQTTQIRGRLRCRECGHRGANKLDVLYGQTDPQGEYYIYREPSSIFGICQ